MIQESSHGSKVLKLMKIDLKSLFSPPTKKIPQELKNQTLICENGGLKDLLDVTINFSELVELVEDDSQS